MILTQTILDAIRGGHVTVAFRRWRRPSVRSGGRLLTSAGQLEIRSVVPIAATDISDRDARHAGFPSREALLDELDRRTEGTLYRIEFGALTADPRVALRQQAALSDAEHEALRVRLSRLDAGAAGGAWTRQVLELIRDHPGLRAADLCRLAGQERLAFKVNVRKLKTLGLTESLEIGYRLSPRGTALMRAVEREL
jgi:hypothetical protein